MDKFIAIYVRRSVSDKDKGNNSLSISAQTEECIKYVGEGAEYKVYCDDGKSGKDIAHRPAFMEMMSEAKEGHISKVIVKKYDRFSRNIREYLNVTDELEKYGVSVVSLSEQFNTETKEGRMMRNNLLSFAEFERETIAARVKDAYSTKAKETGFYQGGKIYYGYQSSRQTINGKTGSVLVPSPQAYSITKAYEMYQHPNIYLQDIIRYFVENNIDTVVVRKGKPSNLDRSHLSRLLESPLYVKADCEVYRYFSALGVEMLDDISAYDGKHGLFLHKNDDGTQYIKVGYHEGLVEPSVWLAVQDRKSHQEKIPARKGTMTSWLTGLVKCSHCGYAYSIQPNGKHRYFRDRGAYTVNGCLKRTPSIRPDEVEKAVFEALQQRLEQLEIAKSEQKRPSAEVATIVSEITRSEAEIENLMSRLAAADDTLFKYIQDRISVLHRKKTEQEQKLRTLQRRHKEIDTKPLSEPLKKWHSLTNDERNAIAKTVIEVIKVSDETGIEIVFSL